jgi:hypothetical protein
MDANATIKKALERFCLPVFSEEYDKKIRYSPDFPFIDKVSEGYFVFNYISESGALYGDNKELEDVTRLYIHLYTKKALEGRITPIKTALTENGFIITLVRRKKEKDTGYNHLTLEVSILSADMEE